MRTIYTVATFIVWIGIILGMFYAAIKFFIEGIKWIKEYKTYKGKEWRKECTGQAVASFAISIFFIAGGLVFLTAPFI